MRERSVAVVAHVASLSRSSSSWVPLPSLSPRALLPRRRSPRSSPRLMMVVRILLLPLPPSPPPPSPRWHCCCWCRRCRRRRCHRRRRRRRRGDVSFVGCRCRCCCCRLRRGCRRCAARAPQSVLRHTAHKHANAGVCYASQRMCARATARGLPASCAHAPCPSASQGSPRGMRGDYRMPPSTRCPLQVFSASRRTPSLLERCRTHRHGYMGDTVRRGENMSLFTPVYDIL